MTNIDKMWCFTLSSLILINCNIDDNGVQVLTKTKPGTNLEILRLDVNKITDTVAETLSKFLSSISLLAAIVLVIKVLWQ